MVQNLIKSFLISSVVAQSRYSSNLCFQEAQKAFGSSITGKQQTDLDILATATSKHRLSKIKYCTSESGQFLRGLQLTVDIPLNSSQPIDLLAFGNMNTTACGEELFKKDDYPSTITFFWDKNNIKVLGLQFMRVNGTLTNLGFVDSKIAQAFTYQFEPRFLFAGFFGSTSSQFINSLGPIRMKTDCAFFPDMLNNTYMLPSNRKPDPLISENKISNQTESAQVQVTNDLAIQQINLVTKNSFPKKYTAIISAVAVVLVILIGVAGFFVGRKRTPKVAAAQITVDNFGSLQTTDRETQESPREPKNLPYRKQ